MGMHEYTFAICSTCLRHIRDEEDGREISLEGALGSLYYLNDNKLEAHELCLLVKSHICEDVDKCYCKICNWEDDENVDEYDWGTDTSGYNQMVRAGIEPML